MPWPGQRGGEQSLRRSPDRPTRVRVGEPCAGGGTGLGVAFSRRRRTMTRAFHALALASALALPSAAQIGSSVGPPVAPIGSPITITFSNDSLATLISGACPYQVYDSDGVLVHSPGCIAIAILVPPGGTLVSEWKQVDDAGQQ